MDIQFSEMQEILMNELRLYHKPIAVTFFFDDEKLDEFIRKTNYVTPMKPITYCQWEIAARMQGQTVLATKELLSCSNAHVSFGWKDIDEKEIKTQLKYCVDLEQAERFMRSKPRLPLGKLKAVAVGPLGSAMVQPDVVHFYCDSIQSYHLAVDYMAATNTHPIRPMITMSSSACGGSVFSYQENTFNMCPPCSGSYNAGKTERGEVNVFIPGVSIETTVKRLITRIKAGSSSITRPGDPFPGADICKNCPLIIFKKGSNDINTCEFCSKC